MMVRGGYTINVYRSTGKDRHGDGEKDFVGTIDGVLMQWGSSSPVDRAEEMSMRTTVVYCPRNTDVQLQARDRFKLNETTYAVIGDRSWDERNPVTGYNFGYYMVQVEAMS